MFYAQLAALNWECIWLKEPRRFHASVRATEADIPAIPAHWSLGKQAFSCFAAEIDRPYTLARTINGVPQTTTASEHVVAGLLPAVPTYFFLFFYFLFFFES